MKKDNVWIIVPAYNESKRIAGVLSKLKKNNRNFIVVDDGSKDNTYDISKKYTPYVLRHIVNLGKGAALKTGCDFLINKNAEVIVFIDSDGQHDPNDIDRFLKELKTKKVDIVFGSRDLNKNMPTILRFGNWFISNTVKLLFNVKLTDSQSGYRAFNTKIYDFIRWSSTGYTVESEIISKVGKHNIKYSEIFINTIYLDKYKGTTMFDGIKIVYTMIKWRLIG